MVGGCGRSDIVSVPDGRRELDVQSSWDDLVVATSDEKGQVVSESGFLLHAVFQAVRNRGCCSFRTLDNIVEFHCYVVSMATLLNLS